MQTATLVTTDTVTTDAIVSLGHQLSGACRVPSQTVYGKTYIVTDATSPFATCTCGDWNYRHLEKSGVCKHVRYVRAILKNLYQIQKDFEKFIVEQRAANAKSSRRIRKVKQEQALPITPVLASQAPERRYRCRVCLVEGVKDGVTFIAGRGSKTRHAACDRRAMWINRPEVEAWEQAQKQGELERV